MSTSRFIPVRSDADRILTCCLDYADDHVRVTDLVHERRGDTWTMRASEYAKLRLAPAVVAAELTAHGLTLERCEPTSRGVVVTARSARGSA
ncbi:MAG: hypothetical protein K8W52_47590 [Deltaproteobacteria bacterium]|nr:hypothetical protein [Deltaproteobacteria bacterium]